MIEWNKVTWYSTSLSLIFFVLVLPGLIFYIGFRYKQVTATFEESQEIIKGSIKNLSDFKSSRMVFSTTTSAVSTTSLPE
jgi:hypothetical protein